MKKIFILVITIIFAGVFLWMLLDYKALSNAHVNDSIGVDSPFYDGIPENEFTKEMYKGVQGNMSLEYVDSMISSK